MGKKVALITGVTGQDGALLAEMLLKKGYEVHGVKRRSSLFNTNRVDHLYQDPHLADRSFVLHYGDLTDGANLVRILQQCQPDEVYNLAAMSHVAVSFEMPEYTADVNALGPCASSKASAAWAWKRRRRFLPGLHQRTVWPGGEIPQRENQPFYPRSPTPCPSSSPTGSRSTTARPTACMPATASCSTTSPRCARRPSSPARSPAPLFAHHARPAGLPCTSATCPPCATGATRATTWRCSGSCCSRNSLRIMSSPRACSTACAIS